MSSGGWSLSRRADSSAGQRQYAAGQNEERRPSMSAYNCLASSVSETLAIRDCEGSMPSMWPVPMQNSVGPCSCVMLSSGTSIVTEYDGRSCPAYDDAQ